MSTTTIRVSSELKARIETLAAASGKSTHAFMLDALSQAADALERQRAFEAEAAKRWAKYQRSGEYITLEDLRAYAGGLVAGKKPAKPKPRARSAPARTVTRA